LTANEPRWRSVTAKPFGVLIVTVFPCVGSQPANEISPAAGARTAVPESAPMSIPVWPCWRYSSPPKSKPRRTGPSTGQLQALAAHGVASAFTTTRISAVAFLVNIAATKLPGRSAVVKNGYRERR
jgi:hypothetical protein